MFNYKNNPTLHTFEISADGGSTWTTQFMTFIDAVNEVNLGHIVKFKVLHKCANCGALVFVEYDSNGNYEHMSEYCECKSKFYPHFSNEPTLSEFVQMFNNTK